MAYNPISQVPIQYSKLDGNPANGYYLKFYVANSSTPITMQTDSGGSTSLAKCKLNEYGFPIVNPLDESTVFIPHLSSLYTAYRIVIYASAADADSNNVTAGLPNIQSVRHGYTLAEQYTTATGNGSQTVFSVSHDVSALFVGGVYQNRSTWSYSGGNVTFTEAPPLNAPIEFLR